MILFLFIDGLKKNRLTNKVKWKQIDRQTNGKKRGYDNQPAKWPMGRWGGWILDKGRPNKGNDADEEDRLKDTKIYIEKGNTL